MNMDLFGEPSPLVLAPGAFVLRQYALCQDQSLLAAVADIAACAPFRHMVTPGGLRMSVAMTNCGTLGWVSDRTGYRYDSLDPASLLPWPAMPPVFMQLACDAAAQAGFVNFLPDACLINRYDPGARLTLHQDKDERDFTQPIVSVSLGLPATFLFGGLERTHKAISVNLSHGDVVVWGGSARLHFHGVRPLKEGQHNLTGPHRLNLTFRKAH